MKDRVEILDNEPVASPRALRAALASFATGVTVVTGTAPGGDPFGLTVNSFSSLSLDPPLILWSLRANSPLAGSFAPGSPFAVNVLAGHQEAIARQFAASIADRFAGLEWRSSPHGLPHIDGAVAHFDCRTTAIHPAGDHRLIIAAVETFAALRDEPLLFVQGAFRSFGRDGTI